MAKGRKISVVGAGAVGTAVAYAALIRQVANEIALYDINTPKVEAEAADLAQQLEGVGPGGTRGFHHVAKPAGDLRAAQAGGGSQMVQVVAGIFVGHPAPAGEGAQQGRLVIPVLPESFGTAAAGRCWATTPGWFVWGCVCVCV